MAKWRKDIAARNWAKRMRGPKSMQRFKTNAHLYAVEVTTDGGTTRKTIDVEATNRDQAARKMAKDGFEVCSVNMIG